MWWIVLGIINHIIKKKFYLGITCWRVKCVAYITVTFIA